jgi:AsmA protein
MESKNGLKILLWVVVALVLLIILTTVIARIVFTKQKLLSLLVPKIEAALNRKVEIDDVSVSIWRGLGAEVGGMRVLNPPGFKQEELFRFDQLSIRIKFWPLLSKRIEVKKLILENPEINLEKNQQGMSNFADLIEGEGGAIVIPAGFDQLLIKEGEIRYSDDQGKKKIALHSFEQKARISLDRKLERAEITGIITIEQIELDLPGYKGSLPPLSFSLEHRIDLNTTDDLLDLKEMKIGIGEIKMDLKGRVENVSSKPALDLVVESEKIPLDDILATLPKEESSPLNRLKTSGDLVVSASVKSTAQRKAPIGIEGRVTLQNTRVDFVRVPQPFEMPYGEITFNNRSLSFFTSQAKLGGAPLELKLVMEDFSDPSLTSELRTQLNLALLGEFVSLPEGVDLKGEAEVNAKAYGKLKKVEGLNFSGRVGLKKVEMKTHALGVPIRNLNADLALKDDDLEISDLSLSLGKSSLNLQGKLYAAIPYFLSPQKEKPLLSFSLDSPLLDLDQILPVKEAEKVEGTAGGQDTVLLPDIKAGGQVFIKRAIFRGIEFNDVSFKMDVAEGVLRLDNIVANVYSGSVGGEVTCDLKDLEKTEFDINLTANQIEANDFLSRFTAFDDRLFGKLNLNADFSGEGNSVEDIQRSLVANGTASFEQGKLVNWELLDKLATLLNMDSFKKLDIRTLRNSFRVEEGRVFFDDFFASAKDGDFNLAGSVGLDGSLDYELTMILSPELSLRFDALGELSEYLKNDQGRVVLDIEISGTAKSPRFAFDTSRAERRLADKLKAEADEKKEEIKEQVKEKAEDLLKNLFKKKKN